MIWSKFRYHLNYAITPGKRKRSDWLLVKLLFNYLKPYRFILLLVMLFLIFSKMIEAFVPILLGKISQNVITSLSFSSHEKIEILKPIFDGCLVIVAMLLITYLLDGTNVILKSFVGQNALFKLRGNVYDHLLKMPLTYYDRNPVGRLMTRTIHDVDQLEQMFSESVIPLVGSIILFFGILACIFFVDITLAIGFLCVLPFAILLTLDFRIHQRRCYDLIRAIVSKLNSFVQEHLMGASTIRSFGIHKLEKREFEHINDDHCTAYQETIHHFSFFFSGIDFIQGFFLAIVFTLLILLTPSSSSFQAGTYFTFSLYTLMIFRPLSDLAERYNVLQSAMAAADRIFDVLETKQETSASMGPKLEKVNSLIFDHVWFSYKDMWVLKDVSFQIKKGESVALVGMTGAGKTSVINLMLQFYKHQKGNISINDQDISIYPLPDLRRAFSLVSQDPVVFSGTLLDNLRLWKQEITEEKVVQTLKDCNLDELIQRFPCGLSEIITERGKALSAGERQLISLARATVLNPSFLILDEATANIDSITETILQKAIGKILSEKTSLVIAHRLSTIQDVDRIIVLHQGEIVEEGSHQSLLEKMGIYEKLYRLQFSKG